MTLAWIGIGVLALCGAPLFVVMACLALLGLYSADQSGAVAIGDVYRIASAPSLLAIPLFTFAGYLMAEGGTGKRLVRISRAALGWLPAGVPMVALLTSAFFTAFTGASGVTIIALGGLLYPVLRQDGYSERFSLGLMTTCGSLGLLLPPALPVILFSVVASNSIPPELKGEVNLAPDAIFIAGVLPCLLLIALLYAYSAFVGLRTHAKREAFSFGELGLALREVFWELPLPIAILLNFYGSRFGLPGGWFTIEQAAAVSVVYAFFVQVVVYRDLHPVRDVPRVARDSMVLIGGILVILCLANAFTGYLILEADAPTKIFGFIREYIHSPWTFLLALNVFLLIVGCMMDIFSAIIVVVPLIVIPAVQEYGIHPIHLAIIFLVNLEIGYLTPPVGVNLFIAAFRFKRPMLEVYRASLAFLLLMIVALATITYWPDLSLELVRRLGMEKPM